MKHFFSRLGCLCALLAGLNLAKADDWQIVNLEGREYVSLENVAAFYQLKNTAEPGTPHMVLADSQPRLETLTDSRELIINGVKEWLAFPTIYKDGQTLVSRFDLAKTIEPSLRPTMIGNLEPFETVVLDAGHGGQDGGGTSASGLEKNYTLAVIQSLKRSLETKGLRVILTRNDDEYIGLEQRADLANAIPNAVFVSVHFNSSADPGAAGVEVYAMTPRGAASTADHNVVLDQFKQMPGNDFDNASLALANCVHSALLGQMDVGDRGVRRARFAVLRLTHAPAVLVEGGFLTNGGDSRLINDPAWCQRLAEAIASGVRGYHDTAVFKLPPKTLADYQREQLPPVFVAAKPARYVLQVPTVNTGLIRVSNPIVSRPISQVRPAGRRGHTR